MTQADTGLARGKAASRRRPAHQLRAPELAGLSSMDPLLDRRFPSNADIECAALKRMPRFARDYLFCGMGLGGAVRRNREALDAVRLVPRYLVDAGKPDCATELFGQSFDAPFGVAPVGMGGIAWPRAAESLAAAAASHRVPFGAATFALASLETLKEHAGDFAWFQLYRPKQAEIEEDLVARAERAGYRLLVVTVDVPAPMRRDHDIRNGFSIPPRLDWRTALEMLRHPTWSLATGLAAARSGLPAFHNIEPYVPQDDRGERMRFMSDLTLGHITEDVLARLRKRWPHVLVVKGLLDAREVVRCREIGVDGVIVSNHGGRQLEAAPSAAEVLPAIRAAVGEGYPLIADGGARTGTDICRLLALGADFVLIGRPFYYAVAAMGPRGADHAMALLKAELACTMGQLGCSRLCDLRQRLADRASQAAAA